MLSHIKVHDHGYVRLVTYTPWNMVAVQEALDTLDLPRARVAAVDHDLAAVNAARASFAKEQEELTDKDLRLIEFLANATPVPHSSPFRHNHVTLEIQCPIIVARQWWRHVIGASTTEEGTPWSELSRRYVRGGIEYHIPETFRAKPDHAKQGSGGDLSATDDFTARQRFRTACEVAVETYEFLVNDLGVAPEQARMCLPQGVYTSFRWTPSIHALANFLIQRKDPHAQKEIRDYAEAVYSLVLPIFPHSLKALVP